MDSGGARSVMFRTQIMKWLSMSAFIHIEHGGVEICVLRRSPVNDDNLAEEFIAMAYDIDLDWSKDMEPDWASDYEEEDMEAFHQFMTITDDQPPKWDTSDNSLDDSHQTKIRWNLILSDGAEEEVTDRPIFDTYNEDTDEDEEDDFEARYSTVSSIQGTYVSNLDRQAHIEAGPNQEGRIRRSKLLVAIKPRITTCLGPHRRRGIYTDSCSNSPRPIKQQVGNEAGRQRKSMMKQILMTSVLYTKAFTQTCDVHYTGKWLKWQVCQVTQCIWNKLALISLQAYKGPELAMRLRLGIGSKAKKFLSSMTSKKSLSAEDAPKGLDSETKQVDFGSKEEAFFDSQGWLDSDCEDDFVSVNGDWTPSREITPNYQITRTPQMNKVFSDPSAVDAKRKLAELLQENEVEQDTKEHGVTGKPELCVVDAHHTSSCVSGINSACSLSEDLKQKKERTMKTNRCCLPISVCNFRLKERRKHKMSPVH
ncbi:hypothetical protein Cni_G20165 [Canna indica]|uniref:Uncharacterized protein n=1 Tax=Canna indica TaxID=4628 RepID=A0AAQ3KM44_9LILI|nr:hypothetical protein Cni_G20165 [Canna indica]